MSRRKILLKFVISMFIIIIGVVFCYFSFQLEKQNYNPTPLKIVFFSLLSIFIILLNVNSILMNKLKNEKIDAEKIENQIFEKKKFSEENYDEYYKQLRKYILYADLYIIAVTLLYSAMYVISCLLFVFFKEYFFIGPIIGITFIIGFSILIGKGQPKNINMAELTEKEFPLLWRLIRKVAKQFEIKKKIKCYFIYDNNAGVIEYDGHIEILLGVQLLHLLNEEELKHILMHEFAHINLNHTSKTKLINKKMEFWHNINVESENLLRGIIRILFYPVLHPLMYHIDVFQMVTSRQKEDEADILVIEKGNKQTHINALAKLNTYDIFTIGELYPVTSIYGPEEIPNNYFELMYQDFLKYYEIYKEKWHELILKRIPARIETHQTFKYRMELAGVLDFQMDFSNKLPEMEKISDYASNIIMNHFKSHYKEERKARYLDHKQLIEEYESNKIDFPKNKLFDLAFAYRILGRIEDAIQIYEELIEEYGERPKYLISKGTAYFSLYDDRGIELVYRAMEKQKNT